MEENLEKKLALLDFLNINYFQNDSVFYYAIEDYNHDNFDHNDFEEVLDYKEYDNPDCTECDNYLVLTDDEANKRCRESMKEYLDMILHEIPKCYHWVIDEDRVINLYENSPHEKRENCLASYDGIENKQNGYYIYKVN